MSLKEFVNENCLKIKILDQNGWDLRALGQFYTLTVIKQKDDVLYVIPSDPKATD